MARVLELGMKEQQTDLEGTFSDQRMTLVQPHISNIIFRPILDLVQNRCGLRQGTVSLQTCVSRVHQNMFIL